MKALILLSLAVSLSSCRPDHSAVAPPQSSPIAVQAASVQWIDTATPVTAPGLLARTLEADLSFKTGGLIDDVTARAGDEVLAGQILGSLRLEELDAALAQAESALNKAKRDLDRASSLFAGNVEPLETRQNAQSGVEQAEAAVRAARFNRQTAVLTAPAAGRILARYAEPGEIAAPGRKILRFASDAEGWLVRVGLAQRDVVRIQVGNEADVSFAGMAEPVVARVARIAGETDPASRTTLVELRLDGTPPPELRSGMVGHATIRPEKGLPRALLPLSALVEGDGKMAHVFRVESAANEGDLARVRRIPVEIAEITQEGVVLRSGIRDRDIAIVITGAELLFDGGEVLVNPAWPFASR